MIDSYENVVAVSNGIDAETVILCLENTLFEGVDGIVAESVVVVFDVIVADVLFDADFSSPPLVVAVCDVVPYVATCKALRFESPSSSSLDTTAKSISEPSNLLFETEMAESSNRGQEVDASVEPSDGSRSSTSALAFVSIPVTTVFEYVVPSGDDGQFKFIISGTV